MPPSGFDPVISTCLSCQETQEESRPPIGWVIVYRSWFWLWTLSASSFSWLRCGTPGGSPHNSVWRFWKGLQQGSGPSQAQSPTVRLTQGPGRRYSHPCPWEIWRGPELGSSPITGIRPACPKTRREMLLFTQLQMLKRPDKTLLRKLNKHIMVGKLRPPMWALGSETCLWTPADQSPIFQLLSLQRALPGNTYISPRKGQRGSKPIYTTKEETNTRFLSCVLKCEQTIRWGIRRKVAALKRRKRKKGT